MTPPRKAELSFIRDIPLTGWTRENIKEWIHKEKWGVYTCIPRFVDGLWLYHHATFKKLRDWGIKPFAAYAMIDQIDFLRSRAKLKEAIKELPSSPKSTKTAFSFKTRDFPIEKTKFRPLTTSKSLTTLQKHRTWRSALEKERSQTATHPKFLTQTRFKNLVKMETSNLLFQTSLPDHVRNPPYKKKSKVVKDMKHWFNRRCLPEDSFKSHPDNSVQNPQEIKCRDLKLKREPPNSREDFYVKRKIYYYNHRDFQSKVTKSLNKGSVDRPFDSRARYAPRENPTEDIDDHVPKEFRHEVVGEQTYLRRLWRYNVRDFDGEFLYHRHLLHFRNDPLAISRKKPFTLKHGKVGKDRFLKRVQRHEYRSKDEEKFLAGDWINPRRFLYTATPDNATRSKRSLRPPVGELRRIKTAKL